ncbi:dTDP-glucose 4,6-dehydratase [Pseudoalteromonas sp. C2R02]|uniref:dTDP-glucose 4,6-dehydratase n=1 Tax=Pseudoalteromonas sp. C2R02 TaxID=2841565 RepID=UPI001C082D78|nr:dTDP-glucose 4,6-dehydratase [Pseudoalteromonas sp. C2R02]MBU2971737.1 dTDP-glucose 4,6-dehydratase [Pseudoalteromonas sp. C2R02]
MKKVIFVTGGSGFIGSTLIRFLLESENYLVVNIDKLTYAAKGNKLSSVEEDPNYFFEKCDICNKNVVRELFNKYKPQLVFHLAAESHVDRSILTPSEFIKTNVLGTAVLLECATEFYHTLPELAKKLWRFHHVSTDEVYGDLTPEEPAFTEQTAYAPSSPYSASKASSDHFVRAWNRTYGLPILITNCSNNYGPYQLPDKLIPLVISNALQGHPIPLYGNGQQIRDWLYVEDHVRALYVVACKGQTGETYNIGGESEMSNISIVNQICEILDNLKPINNGELSSYKELITFVKDRPGHDKRYAVDNGKLRRRLGWQAENTLDVGLEKTVDWYLKNLQWCESVKT